MPIKIKSKFSDFRNTSGRIKAVVIFYFTCHSIELSMSVCDTDNYTPIVLAGRVPDKVRKHCSQLTIVIYLMDTMRWLPMEQC